MGLTVLDAGVVIALLDASDRHHAEARRALEQALLAADELVLPVSAYAEALVGPMRRGAAEAAIVDALVDALPARVEPASRLIAQRAAQLRARFGVGLRLPDALVIATALHLGADRIITTDAGWPKVDVPVEVLHAP